MKNIHYLMRPSIPQLPMTNKPAKNVYWDTNLFIHFMNDHPVHAPVIEGIWDEVRQKGGKVVTSQVAKVELVLIGGESGKELDESAEKQLDAFWDSPNLLIADLTDWVLKRARRLIREAKQAGFKGLKPLDAIHLATAQWVNDFSPNKIAAFYTYDEPLWQFGPLIGIPTVEPTVLEPKMTGLYDRPMKT